MNNNEFISNALKFISGAYEEDLSLEQVAEKAGFSISYFNRIFAESTGKTVMEYVRECRLIKAAESLRTSDKSVLEISLDCKYSNPENFTRAFKCRYGKTPSDYRAEKKNKSLCWNDLSAGTSINRFANQFPQYQQVDKDEFTDWLYTQNPVKHAFTICFASQIQSAAFKLSKEEYVYIEEYRAEEMTATLYCREENILKYISLLSVFQNCTITVVCDPACSLNFSDAQLRYDYAYLKDSVSVDLPKEYKFCFLTADDSKEIKQFSKYSNNRVWNVFEQYHKFGNFAGTLFFGLRKNGRLVACAMPGIEKDRGLEICDIGGIFTGKDFIEHDVFTNFWKAIVSHCLKNGRIPINGGVTADDEKLGCTISEEIGYTCTAMKFIFSL